MSIFDKLKALFPGSDSNGSGSNGMGRAVMLSCEDALRLVHEFLDGELDPAAEGQVQKHFDMCQRCYPHLHLETAYRDAVRRAALAKDAPPELKAKVSALIAEAEASS
jgi:anti-sigma factor (TIGR02949 family)